MSFTEELSCPSLPPVGEEDFRELIVKKFLFVDKTLLIKELLDNINVKVSLITRPRRFGKTLNLSMLRYFFAEEIKNELTKDLFNGLKISQAGEKYMAHQGKYPVIFLTFKQLEAESYEAMLGELRRLMSRLYKTHRKLLDSPYLLEEEKNDFRKIINCEADESHLKVALFDLTEYLYRHYKKKVIVLIDEYDVPIQSGYFNQYYKKNTIMIRGLLGNCLKTNPYLERALLTGTARIVTESLFSGLNNLIVYSLLSNQYAEHFGFTAAEVEMLVKKAGYENKLAEMKEWYNGYKAGNTSIYNPWSIINCVVNGGSMKSYCLNASENKLIKELLIKSFTDFKQDLENLLQGKSIHKFIRENIILSDSNMDQSFLWSLLFLNGYLKIVSFTHENGRLYCKLKIANREAHVLYRSLVKSCFRGKRESKEDEVGMDNLLTDDKKFTIDLKSDS